MRHITVRERHWTLFDRLLEQQDIKLDNQIQYNFQYGRHRVYDVPAELYNKAFACWKQCFINEPDL